MIAVIGATGNTGRAVVKELQTLGEDPLCIVRNAQKAREVLGASARTAVAEITDQPGLTKALQGVRRVFVVTGHNPQAGDQQIGILEACKAAGVEFFAKVSGGRAVVGPNVESVVGRGHHAVEEAMQRSGLAWVILRPGLFMQNTLAQAQSIKAEGKMVLAFPKDLPIAFIDVRDTGAVGARIMRDPSRHAGKTYEFTGADDHPRPVRPGLLRGAGQAGDVRRRLRGAGRAGHEGAGHAGLAGGAHGGDGPRRGQRRLLQREHPADPGYRRARSDHDPAVRGGL